jgi:salicylate hydroxylase
MLGDAVHCLRPVSGQGAGMAIEDAAVLAKVLSEAPLEPGAQVAAALQRYGRARRARVTHVQQLARKQGRIYHMTGAMALARDLTIRALGPERVLARQAWIYDWRL